MGWIHEEMPGHEGYLVALVEREAGSGDWRELGRGPEKAADVMRADAAPKRELAARVVQVACECGWRSPRIDAPYGVTWAPFTVDAPEPFEEEAADMWREHIRQQERAEIGMCARGRHTRRDRCPSTIGERCIARDMAGLELSCARCGAPPGVVCIDPHGKQRAPHARRGAR